MDTASLRIAINTGDVKKANDELDKLSKTSGSAENQTTKLTKSFSNMSTVIASMGVGALASEFIKIADEMKLLDARLKMVSASTAEYVSQKKELLAISKETYSSVSEITTLYTKLDPALKQLGATTKEVNTITESFAKGLKLGGANTAEAASATLQFAQAMGSGVLRGEEFNAIAEASPKLMKYLADGLGVPQTALRKMAMEGELTAERVSAALLKMTTQIDKDFKQIPMTVGMATTNLKTELSIAIEEFDKTNKISQTLAESIQELTKYINGNSDAVDELVGHIKSVSIAAASFYGTTLAVTGVKALSNVTTGLKSVTAAQAAMNVAAWANPWVILAGAIAGASFALSEYKDLQDEISKNTAKASGQSAFLKDLQFISGKDKKQQASDLVKISKELRDEQVKLLSIYKEHQKFAYQSSKNDKEQEARLARIKSIHEEQEAIKKYIDTISKPIATQSNKPSALSTTAPNAKEKKEKKKGKSDEEKEREAAYKKEMELDHALAQSKLSNISKITLEEQRLSDLREQAAVDSEIRANKILKSLITPEQELIDILNEEFASIENFASDEQMEKWSENANERLQKLATDLENTDFAINLRLYGFDDVTKSIATIANSIGDTVNSFDTFGKSIKNIKDEQSKLTKEQLKDTKTIAIFEDKRLQSNLELGSSITANAASLIGGMASFYDEDDSRRKKMMELQKVMNVITLVGQTAQMALEYEILTIKLAQLTVAGKAAILGQLSVPIIGFALAASAAAVVASLGIAVGGGGSGSSGISAEGAKSNQIDAIEASYEPITDRLDRQIQLLEDMNLKGSVGVTSIARSQAEFLKDLQLVNTEAIYEMGRGFASINLSSISGSFLEKIAAGYGMSPLQKIAKLNEPTKTFQFGTNLNYDNQIKAFNELVGMAQEAITDYASTMINTVSEMQDAGDTFKELFDDITNTTTYADKELVKAQSIVSGLIGDRSLATYLSDQIDAIDELSSAFGVDIQKLLISTDRADLQRQADAVDALALATNQAFSNGVEDALNYINSIELVSESMARSTSNINKFLSSLNTSEENAMILAKTLNVDVATSVDELASMFQKLSTDLNGLTNSDIELLNVNKELLENTDNMKKSQEGYNKTLEDTTRSISTLDNVMETITSTIDKLKSASRTSEQNLQVFYDAMAEAQRLSKTDDYAAYADAVRKAADASSALLNKDNFKLSRDMEYAQLVAAQQFEDLGDTTLTQIDYLKQIEINTRTQIDVLVEAMNSLGASISSSLKGKISANNPEQWVGNTWTSTGGAVATGTSSNFNIATIGGQNISSSEAIKFVQDQLASGNERAIYDAALATGISAASLDAMMGWTAGTSNSWAALNGLQSFAVGTPNVPYDMLAQIHQGEMIVPKPEAQAWRNGALIGNQTMLVVELQKNNSLLNGIITNQEQQIQILLESRDIQNGSLVVLENIEGII